MRSRCAHGDNVRNCRADTEPGETRILKKLLGAVEVNDYDSFVADGNAAFKALTKQMLESVSIQLSTRMKKGYDTTYLGQLKQQWGQVYLWKLVYKDGGDDTLVKLVLKNGKVAGFWLQQPSRRIIQSGKLC